MPRGSKPGERRGGRQRGTPNKSTALKKAALLRHTSRITYGFFGEAAVTKLYANPQLYAGDFDNAEFADHSTDVLGR
jgi:hypothetical protein